MNLLSSMRRLALASVLATSVAIGVLPSTAEATVVVPLTRAQLVQKSDLVVRATVLSRTSFWNADKTQILTQTRLRVASWLKGSSAQEVVLEQIGGTVNGVTSRVDGDASLSVGEDVVLMLRAQNQKVYLTALALAAYHVNTAQNGTQTASRDLSGLSFAQMVNGKYVIGAPPIELPEKLDHLLDELGKLGRAAQ